MNELINFAGKATVIYFAVFCLFYISDGFVKKSV